MLRTHRDEQSPIFPICGQSEPRFPFRPELGNEGQRKSGRNGGSSLPPANLKNPRFPLFPIPAESGNGDGLNRELETAPFPANFEFGNQGTREWELGIAGSVSPLTGTLRSPFVLRARPCARTRPGAPSRLGIRG